jgi:hypothetical protein
MKTVAIENEFIGDPGLPAQFVESGPLTITALPAFLKSIIGRTNFSFTNYLRTNLDASSELHQWIRGNYLKFRALDDGINAPPAGRLPGGASAPRR